MKNKKSKLVLGLILFVVFLLGFMSNSLINKDTKKTETFTDTEELISKYSNLPEAIDSIENLSVCYYDTANLEMLHYVLEYNDKHNTSNYYITNFGDSIEYNKENFYRYVALYTVAENLLETRKHIINGLMMDSEINKINKIRNKVED